jgi:hypothetical protein
VKNVSDLARDREIREFFSFSGEIEHVDLKRQSSFFSFSNFLSDFLSILCTSRECYRNFFFSINSDESGIRRVAFVTFKDPSALEIALRLSVHDIPSFSVIW